MDGGAVIGFDVIVARACIYPVADAPGDGVITGAADQDVGTFGVVEPVVAGTSHEYVAVGSASQVVVLGGVW